jgi:hypothetical protein
MSTNDQLERAKPATQNIHRIEVRISGGFPGGLRGDITFKGVCDAKDGAPCRMWCKMPDCREEAQDGHEDHVLSDQGECGVISSLNADPGFIPELYDGPETQLRPGFIDLSQDIDGVTWRYSAAAVSEQVPVAGATCENTCHHRCPECRMGLGSHLTCDPLCDHHRPAAVHQNGGSSPCL